jgi:hypothetical protein
MENVCLDVAAERLPRGLFRADVGAKHGPMPDGVRVIRRTELGGEKLPRDMDPKSDDGRGTSACHKQHCPFNCWRRAASTDSRASYGRTLGGVAIARRINRGSPSEPR